VAKAEIFDGELCRDRWARVQAEQTDCVAPLSATTYREFRKLAKRLGHSLPVSWSY